MKVHLWSLGAPSEAWVSTGELNYVKRIERYLPFSFNTFRPSKATDRETVLQAESIWLKKQIESTPTFTVILDEKGKSISSIGLADKLEQWRQGPYKRVVFIIGSAYGFDPSIKTAANEIIRISDFTLPHQLVRLIMLEQIYRACTILKGESYHHE